MIFWTLWDQCFLLWKRSVRSDLHHSVNVRSLWLWHCKGFCRSGENFRKKPVLEGTAVFAARAPGLSFFLPALFHVGTKNLLCLEDPLCRGAGRILAYLCTDTNRRSDIKDPQFSMQREKKKPRSAGPGIPGRVSYGNQSVLKRGGSYLIDHCIVLSPECGTSLNPRLSLVQCHIYIHYIW